MLYTTVIRNELGHIVIFCDTLSQDQIDTILESHPEYYISTEQVKMEDL